MTRQQEHRAAGDADAPPVRAVAITRRRRGLLVMGGRSARVGARRNAASGCSVPSSRRRRNAAGSVLRTGPCVRVYLL